MNKQELIAAVLANKDAGMESKAAAERAVNAVIEAISCGIKQDGNVQLIGFGTFNVTDVKARPGRNPQTGKAMTIKAHKKVNFKVGSALKEAVNKPAKKCKKK